VDLIQVGKDAAQEFQKMAALGNFDSQNAG
jgi:hypothetical protein